MEPRLERRPRARAKQAVERTARARLLTASAFLVRQRRRLGCPVRRIRGEVCEPVTCAGGTDREDRNEKHSREGIQPENPRTRGSPTAEFHARCGLPKEHLQRRYHTDRASGAEKNPEESRARTRPGAAMQLGGSLTAANGRDACQQYHGETER